jgi:hypothetical protein
VALIAAGATITAAYFQRSKTTPSTKTLPSSRRKRKS